MSEAVSRLVQIVARLRGDEGCPWDRQQTRESLRPHLLEEAYEVLEAIEVGAAGQLKEELGDLLLQIVFHSQIAHEKKEFDLEDVVEGCIEKVVRRHPHVFGENRLEDSEAVLQQWEELKRLERAANGQNSEMAGSSDQGLLSGLPKALPALLLAHQAQARASRVGFDWKSRLTEAEDHGIWDKLQEEIRELQDAIRLCKQEEIEREVGDLFFTVVNLARLAGVEAETALRRATRRFMQRFKKMEDMAHAEGKGLHEMDVQEMDELWERAKGSGP